MSCKNFKKVMRRIIDLKRQGIVHPEVFKENY